MEHESKRAELLTQILKWSTSVISACPLLQQLPAAPHASITRVLHLLWMISAFEHGAVTFCFESLALLAEGGRELICSGLLLNPALCIMR